MPNRDRRSRSRLPKRTNLCHLALVGVLSAGRPNLFRPKRLQSKPPLDARRAYPNLTHTPCLPCGLETGGSVLGRTAKRHTLCNGCDVMLVTAGASYPVRSRVAFLLLWNGTHVPGMRAARNNLSEAQLAHDEVRVLCLPPLPRPTSLPSSPPVCAQHIGQVPLGRLPGTGGAVAGDARQATARKG